MNNAGEVLFRPKFDKYFLNDEERWVIINKLEINAKLFAPDISITDCRDPKDNKFLELAISANASCIITGDKDLLVLHPFRGIPILNAVDL
ncbi:MAG: putative toxin-antitoxin system toxin component, PIN family [Segetibacter sp.]